MSTWDFAICPNKAGQRVKELHLFSHPSTAHFCETGHCTGDPSLLFTEPKPACSSHPLCIAPGQKHATRAATCQSLIARAGVIEKVQWPVFRNGCLRPFNGLHLFSNFALGSMDIMPEVLHFIEISKLWVKLSACQYLWQ